MKKYILTVYLCLLGLESFAGDYRTISDPEPGNLPHTKQGSDCEMWSYSSSDKIYINYNNGNDRIEVTAGNGYYGEFRDTVTETFSWGEKEQTIAYWVEIVHKDDSTNEDTNGHEYHWHVSWGDIADTTQGEESVPEKTEEELGPQDPKDYEVTEFRNPYDSEMWLFNDDKTKGETFGPGETKILEMTEEERNGNWTWHSDRDVMFDETGEELEVHVFGGHPAEPEDDYEFTLPGDYDGDDLEGVIDDPDIWDDAIEIPEEEKDYTIEERDGQIWMIQRDTGDTVGHIDEDGNETRFDGPEEQPETLPETETDTDKHLEGIKEQLEEDAEREKEELEHAESEREIIEEKRAGKWQETVDEIQGKVEAAQGDAKSRIGGELGSLQTPEKTQASSSTSGWPTVTLPVIGEINFDPFEMMPWLESYAGYLREIIIWASSLAYIVWFYRQLEWSIVNAYATPVHTTSGGGATGLIAVGKQMIMATILLTFIVTLAVGFIAAMNSEVVSVVNLASRTDIAAGAPSAVAMGVALIATFIPIAHIVSLAVLTIILKKIQIPACLSLMVVIRYFTI